LSDGPDRASGMPTRRPTRSSPIHITVGARPIESRLESIRSAIVPAGDPHFDATRALQQLRNRNGHSSRWLVLRYRARSPLYIRITVSEEACAVLFDCRNRRYPRHRRRSQRTTQRIQAASRRQAGCRSVVCCPSERAIGSNVSKTFEKGQLFHVSSRSRCNEGMRR
jgi:hypothetical protein